MITLRAMLLTLVTVPLTAAWMSAEVAAAPASGAREFVETIYAAYQGPSPSGIALTKPADEST